MKILYSKAIIYARLSKNNKYEQNSIDTQISICKKFADDKNLKIMGIISEIKSARKVHLLHSLNDIINTGKNLILLINTVDRFSRDLIGGCKLLKKALSKNIQIIFVSEGLTNTDVDLNHQIRVKMSFSEQESDRMGERIKRMKNAKRKRGEWPGGRTPYGHVVKKKKKVKEEYEQNVIDFIVAAKIGKVSSKELSELMFNICNCEQIPIRFFDKYDNEITHFKRLNMLTYREIADLLNEYNVPRRKFNKKWTSSYVMNIYQKNKNNNTVNENKTVSIKTRFINYIMGKLSIK